MTLKTISEKLLKSGLIIESGDMVNEVISSLWQQCATFLSTKQWVLFQWPS